MKKSAKAASAADAGLLDAIRTAMDAEAKASKFYRESADKASGERGRLLLRQLSQFEQAHYDKLEELRASLADQGRFVEYGGTDFKSFTGEIPSESAGKAEAHLDDVLAILDLAIRAETEANARYRKLASLTPDPRGKAMFLKLADEETLHRRILADEHYHL
ncbi:MAG: ferritin family protein, partial [Planctomycetes bacterium]|nr:ferritin family protein [Planctomycetota bacterium]